MDRQTDSIPPYARQGVFNFHRFTTQRPKRPERLFLGVFPDGEALSHILEYRRRFRADHRLGRAWSDTKYPHVSLHHLGDFRIIREQTLYAARQAARTVSVPPFEITFHSVTSFETRPGRYPLVLLGESEALRELHRSLGTALPKWGLRAAEDFTPHLTLLYGPSLFAERPVDLIRCRIGEIALIHSRLWLSQYRWMGRWPLTEKPSSGNAHPAFPDGREYRP